MPIVGYLEKRRWIAFDETRFEPGTNSRRRHLFQIPLGQNDYDMRATKQLINTNSLQAGMLDPPKSMLVWRLNVLFLNQERPLRLFETSAYRHMLIQFKINRKIYWESPAWQCASPFALFDTPETEIPKMKERYGIEWHRVGANFQCLDAPVETKFPDHQAKDGLVIFCQECFEVRADWFGKDFEEPLDLHVYLEGVLSRVVI